MRPSPGSDAKAWHVTQAHCLKRSTSHHGRLDRVASASWPDSLGSIRDPLARPLDFRLRLQIRTGSAGVLALGRHLDVVHEC
jgi:hypothetical protein